jgi:hypothetical protein
MLIFLVSLALLELVSLALLEMDNHVPYLNVALKFIFFFYNFYVLWQNQRVPNLKI